MIMRPLKVVIPVVTLAVLTLIAALPWGLPSQHRFFLPLLPVVGIHYWSLRRAPLVVEWYVFMTGLTLDILTNGPLGYWALIYLLAHLSAVLSAPAAPRGPGTRLLLLAFDLAFVTAVAWILSSIYFLEAVDWRPYAIGAAYAGLFAIVLVPLLRALDPSQRRDANLTLVRES